MTPATSWMAEYFWWAVGLALIVLISTIYIFKRRRGFDEGPREGEARNPAKVRRQNPPDPDRPS